MKVQQGKLVQLLTELGVSDAADWPPSHLAEKVNAPGGVSRYVDASVPFPGSAESYDLLKEIVAFQVGGNAIEVEPPAEEPPFATGAGEEAPPAGANGVDVAVVGEDVTVVVMPSTNGFHAHVEDGPSAFTSKKELLKFLDRVIPDFDHLPAPTPKKGGRRKKIGRPKGSTTRKAPPPGKTKIPTVGVSKAIYDVLVRAGRTKIPKPVTKEEIVAHLTAKFPDRSPDKMRSTVNNLVPTRFVAQNRLDVQRKRLGDVMGYYILEPKAVASK